MKKTFANFVTELIDLYRNPIVPVHFYKNFKIVSTRSSVFIFSTAIQERTFRGNAPSIEKAKEQIDKGEIKA